MKESILLLIISFITAITLNAQELIPTMKNDDLAFFKTQVNAENINECIEVGNSSYNYLAISIKVDAKNIFKWLLDSKVDLEHSCSGKSALLYAAKYGKLEMIKTLLEYGADINADNKGKTAYDYAKKYKQEEIAKYLKSVLDKSNEK